LVIIVKKKYAVTPQEYMIPCLSKSIFGLDCPGCGLQRSLVLLSKGDFLAAFQMFPAVYSTIFFFGFVGLHFFDKSRNYQKMMIWSAYVNGAIMIIAYFIKMFNL
jgi:hypothetical protein